MTEQELITAVVNILANEAKKIWLELIHDRTTKAIAEGELVQELAFGGPLK